MPTQIGVWRLDGPAPKRLPPGHLPTEAELETFLEHDPSLLGQRLLVIGRQVKTPYNKWIDLLAMDSDANLHVLELKRDRTPREVTAQILDYGSWVSTLDPGTIVEIANEHLARNRPAMEFEPAFHELFGFSPPDELNTEKITMTIVATSLDDSSERIVNYLREFGLAINAVFFSYLEDEDRRYLARSWLVPDSPSATTSSTPKASKKAEWNGRDWFVTFGESDHRHWEDARTHGFVSAGGGEWYSRTLRSLPVGARIFVHIPKYGYVGVGETIGEAKMFDEAEVFSDGRWKRLSQHPLNAPYEHEDPGLESGVDMAEYVVPVRWETTVSKSEAYWVKGLFANQNSAGKLRQAFTLDRLIDHFELQDE